MKFLNLDKEAVKEAALHSFPKKYVEVDEADFFVRDIYSGDITIDGVEQPLYVSTNYVYEDHLINGNDTRFKTKLTTITVKKDAYDIVYDSFGSYYVACQEQDIQFIPYEDFYDLIKERIHLLEEKKEA
ncbi:hypothetical protein [[Eubacterium] hominis]|uniref:hypothetical protein n=1 Tax=[Eubacterium] hominis TaxID=2764325 RepID=UPI003A4DB544